MATARMGFYATAIGMIECLRANRRSLPSLSDVHTANNKSRQAATPCAKGFMPASGAVNDNASKALAADVRLHSPLTGAHEASEGAFFCP